MSLAEKMISVSNSSTYVSEYDDVVVDEDVCALDARENDDYEQRCSSEVEKHVLQSNNKSDGRRKSLFQKIIDDFKCPSDDNDSNSHACGGDRKILRAICRTATVNAAIFTTAVTGGAALAPIVVFATGGAIAAKRLSAGIQTHDNREITKSVTVFGSATCASMIGQAVTTTVMLTVFHAALPLVAVMAVGVGCCSGTAVGAVSEWTVDSFIDGMQEETNKCVTMGSQSFQDEEQTNMSSEVVSSSQHSHPITPNEHKKIITLCNRG